MNNKSYTHIVFVTNKLKKLLVCLTFTFFLLNKMSAQQFNNWVFPNSNGLNFNTTPPSITTNNFIGVINFSCASISDKNGNLLFYSNGMNIWNRNNQLMPNGFGLKGEGCQINGIIIIPFLNDSSKYLVFTSRGFSFNTNQPDTLRYSYSVVDMNLNGGLGDVTNKNIDIRGFAAEKMTAVPHANGIDIWWICRDWTNHFYSYKITCQGFQNNNPIISTVGNNTNNNILLLSSGDIKASSDGKFIACAYRNYFEIYQFNNTTGVLSNSIKIPTIDSYGIEFSPNSKFLYVGMLGYPRDGYTASVYQFNLNTYDSAIIYNTAIAPLMPNENSNIGYFNAIGDCGLQLGPDGKIYATGSGNNVIHRINNPNNLGNAANFQDSIMFMPNPTYRRFPYAYVNLITAQNVQIPSYSVASDCRTVTLTCKTYIKGNNLTFKWKFGDGDSTVQIVPSGGDTTYTTVTHFYPPGIDTFNVQLFVTSDTVCGLGSADKKVIVKPPPPTAKFGAAISCNNLTVNFTDSSLLNFNPSLSYQWQFFNKQNVLLGSSFSQNTLYTFPTLDTFKIRLIVRSALACVQADTLTKTIVLKAKPTANFSYNNTCGSLAATFTNTSTVVADTLQNYYWNFGDGNSSTIKNPNHNYAAFGSYTVKLLVTSASGCVSDTFNFPVSLKAKPVANFIYNNNGCAGLPVLLQDSAYVTNSSIATYYWQLPNGNSFNTATINPVFTSGANYAIRYAVSSAQGCQSDTLIKTIFIESIPLAAIVPVIGGCANESLSFVSSSSIAFGNIKNYQWKFTNTDSITQPNPNNNFIFTNAGNYNITHQVVSNNGCVSNTATTPITIQSKPIAAFSNGLICLGKQVDFLNESSNAVGAIVNTQWFINNTLISNNSNVFNYTFNQAGNYQVSLKVATANDCSDAITKNIVVAPAIANAGNDSIVREGEPFVLNGSGGVSYVWQPPTGLDDITKSNPVGILNNSQQYTVKITTAQGCVGFDTVLITVLRNLKIPNAFSPNGDGIHETWEIEQLKDYPNASVQLFNKNGQLVYSAKGNSIVAWNGMMNNKPVPVGVYYYVIALNSPLSSKPYSGWVMVVK